MAARLHSSAAELHQSIGLSSCLTSGRVYGAHRLASRGSPPPPERDGGGIRPPDVERQRQRGVWRVGTYKKLSFFDRSRPHHPRARPNRRATRPSAARRAVVTSWPRGALSSRFTSVTFAAFSLHRDARPQPSKQFLTLGRGLSTFLRVTCRACARAHRPRCVSSSRASSCWARPWPRARPTTRCVGARAQRAPAAAPASAASVRAQLLRRPPKRGAPRRRARSVRRRAGRSAGRRNTHPHARTRCRLPASSPRDAPLGPRGSCSWPACCALVCTRLTALLYPPRVAPDVLVPSRRSTSGSTA